MRRPNDALKFVLQAPAARNAVTLVFCNALTGDAGELGRLAKTVNRAPSR